MQKLYSLLAREEAQTMAEYATVLTVITLACLAAFGLLAAASSGAIGRVAALFT
jgi:Flp pilus assembly pilin Flp